MQNYKISLSFDRAKKSIAAETVVTLKPLKDNFSSVELDAVGLNFETVSFAGETRPLRYKTGKEKVLVELSKSFKTGDSISIRFKYSCKPKKGIYFVEEKRDGDKIVHSEQIWTQGEPDEARHWIPSYDFPDDKATTEMFITSRADETVISNGELIEKTSASAGNSTYHFKMSIPHSTYLISFIVGKYSKKTDSYNDVPLGFYVYPGEESIVESAFSDTKEMLRIFGEATAIEYPYNKYDQTIVDNFAFGGMENITATTYADSEILLSRLAHLQGFTIDLVSHELAHSWFGNLVTCRNWAELWLNEGFATYMEAVYRGRKYGGNAYLTKIKEDATTYLTGDAANTTKHGLYNLTANNTADLFRYPNITYNKGSVVIHLLKETVGEENFWKAIRLYLNRHKFSNVETKDLQTVFEEVSGKNLDQFFQQWIYKTGHPKLEVKPVYDSANKSLTLNISQVQKADNLVPAVFNFPLEVFIQTAGGEEKVETLNIDSRAQNFSIKLNDRPTEIVVDKNSKMPLHEAKTQAIKFQP